jgi:hypothetical protein
MPLGHSTSFNVQGDMTRDGGGRANQTHRNQATMQLAWRHFDHAFRSGSD